MEQYEKRQTLYRSRTYNIPLKKGIAVDTLS